ncbi:DUF2637 domain-containing protein [Streptomyces turgidiscabies]|uniref:DUF2637 domain-containing protein n=1 Tax=Streptomyces turgidiscabies (strain Car8) TaxID=698760 RepID=L7EZN7_STRT8|nr:DUF2637 domain-containing protein [Streptomyces turgidiscabies]ELP64166.1 hypothetical protein STRTUCAR8_05570 [Streptomyces turgidiscabies Car8]MDX3492122.1 DUF2637 domain-containing protein [Streptomyces turgidiscabies]
MAELHPSAPTHPSTIHPRGVMALAITAAALIFLLTGVSLWLSYEHLHDVGARHGFADDPIRAWAWPATLDLFYAAGEVLILRAALARRVDWWAIGLVVFGAGGSIALNIAGVGPGAEVLDYVVAAVPPVASLLAFGALMSQVYRALAQPRIVTPVSAPVAPATAPVIPPVPTEAPALPAASAPWTQAVPASVRLLPIVARPAAPAIAPAPPRTITYSDPRCAVIRPLYDTVPPTRPGTKAMRDALVAAGYEAPSDGIIRGTLRTEVEAHEKHLAQLPPAPFAIGA